MAEMYEPPKVDYSIEGSHVCTDGTYRGKVTGTAMGGILGCSPWSSPFQAACYALGLASKDISDKPAVKAGKALESVVIDYMSKNYPEIGAFVPAEEIYEAREGAHDSWASDFEDEIFAGHVDGIVMTEDGTDLILEVKTSSNMSAWEDGVPEYYFWQVALYNHFITKQDHAYVALGIMDPEALKDPSTWVPSEANTALFDLQIDQEYVDRTLEEIREWYNMYIAHGITPDYDPTNPRDVELFEHLLNLTADESSVSDLIEQMAKVRVAIDEKEREIEPLTAFEDNLKTKIKDYMDCHELSELVSTGGSYRAVLTRSTRRKVDAAKLREAGIDPEPFMTTTETKSFTIKHVKE